MDTFRHVGPFCAVGPNVNTSSGSKETVEPPQENFGNNCYALEGGEDCSFLTIYFPMVEGTDLENEVVGLLQTRRYDPAILPQLEEYVDYQVTEQLCDADTNMAVLKLYQFYPEKYNASTVAKILIKSLMTLPSTDFLCALYLVPERRQVDEPIPVITHLASLLETGCFKEFWEASGACADLLASVPGSVAAVRSFMISVITRTYKTVDLAVLKALLNVNHSDVHEILEANDWTIADDIVTIPANDENQPRPPVIDEQLSFRQVAARML